VSGRKRIAASIRAFSIDGSLKKVRYGLADDKRHGELAEAHKVFEKQCGDSGSCGQCDLEIVPRSLYD